MPNFEKEAAQRSLGDGWTLNVTLVEQDPRGSKRLHRSRFGLVSFAEGSRSFFDFLSSCCLSKYVFDFYVFRLCF